MSTFVKIGLQEYNTDDVAPPSERTFREAWSIDDNASNITINLEKAKNIWRDYIRRARQPLLEDLDLQFARAQETGADTTAIVAEKQALRDAPALASITNATTLDELKAIQPIAGIRVEES